MPDLTQEEKLRALGLRGDSSQGNPLIYLYEKVRDEYGEGNYSTFKSDVQGLSTFDAFETHLQNNVSFTADEASLLRGDIEPKWADFSAFSTSLDNFDNFDEWINSYNTGNSFTGPTRGQNGRANAGLRVHGTDGVSFAGVEVPAGTVEIYGPRVELSETEATTSTPDTSQNTTNLQVSDTTPALGFPITISADVENTGSYETQIAVVLTEDWEFIDSKMETIAAGSTKTVSFSRTYTEPKEVEVRVNSAGPTTVTVVPPLIFP